MIQRRTRLWALIGGWCCLLALNGLTAGQPSASPGASGQRVEVPEPAWFKISFLDLPEDVKEAAQQNKRLLLYFHQDGCPYCSKLLAENFGPPALAKKTRRHFDVVSLNLWGDRELTDFAGKATTEKAFARQQRVQFTPTLMFYDEQGRLALRLNGFVPPAQFEKALDYVAGKLEKRISFSDYLQQSGAPSAPGRLHKQAWLLPPPLDLARPDSRPLLVVFEQAICATCAEMHQEGFARPEVKHWLARFRVAQVDIAAPDLLRTPSGRQHTMRDWARQLNIVYTPSLVFFDLTGQEVFRVEAYVRAFHLASSLEYVAIGAYREQPEFQRFIEARASAQRTPAQGVRTRP